MACEYLNEDNGCEHGLPVVKKYYEFICTAYPEKCPVYVTKMAEVTDGKDISTDD